MRCLLVLVVSVALPACAGPVEVQDVIALEHATVIDGRGGVPLANQTIILRSGRIEAVQPADRSIPAGARRIDLSGRWVIPGLIDSHVHLKSRPRDPGAVEAILESVLTRSGITTVRDMGGRGSEVAALAHAAAARRITAPDIVFSALFTGPRSRFWLDGEPGTYIAVGAPPGTLPWFRHFAGGTDFAGAVREAKALGARGIKAHSGFDATELRALGQAAQAEGLALWTHAHVNPARPSDAVDAGASVISHADMLAYEGLDEAPAGFAALDYVARTRVAMKATPIEGARLAALFRKMRDRGVCLEPTLQVFTPRTPDPAMDDYANYAARATGRAHKAGVAICAGTDGIGGSTANLPIELALLVDRAGLTPLEAITAATYRNAQALGLTDRGAIVPGLRADMVVLCADPSVDIAAVKSVAAVVARGTYLPLSSACLAPTRPRA